jgi:hypothetical protein
MRTLSGITHMHQHGRGKWVVSCEGKDQISCEHKRMAVLITKQAAHALTGDPTNINPHFLIRWVCSTKPAPNFARKPTARGELFASRPFLKYGS